MTYQEWKILSPFKCIPAAWNYRHFHRNCKKWEQEYETISLWSKWVSETKYVLKYRNVTNCGSREMQSVQCCLSCMWKRFSLNRFWNWRAISVRNKFVLSVCALFSILLQYTGIVGYNPHKLSKLIVSLMCSILL